MALALALCNMALALALALVAVLGLGLGFKDTICGLGLVGEKQNFNIVCRLYETRSSADADNGLDAFVGQSRSTNISGPFQVK